MKYLIIGISLVVLLNGCASTPTIGKQTIVERSASSKPEWETKTFFEKESQMFFSGTITNVFDMALGFRQAKAEAMKNIIESLKTKARTEFSTAIKGQNLSKDDLGRIAEDVVTWVAQIDVSGVIQKETYYEKIEEITHTGVKHSYNCSVLLQLDKKFYLDARENAINNAIAKQREVNNQAAVEAAENAKKRLLE